MSNYSEISFFEFQERFMTEDACFQYLKKLRWPDGFNCPQCGHTEAYFMKRRKVFQSYLSEFCYRFNRRFNQLLITDRRLTACLNTSTITYAELTQ